jgi:hypothetical protein
VVVESADLSDVMLRVVGGFYALAGYVAARSALMSQFLDRAIAAIAAQKPKAMETAQNAWLLIAAVFVLAGGVLLMAGLAIAAPVFALSSLGQIAYLFFVAPRYFDVEDPPDESGRRASTNAFVLYLAATAFVLWGAYTGKLVGIDDVPWPVLVVAVGTIAAFIGYLAWMLAKVPGKSPLLGGVPDTAGADQVQRAGCSRIKVMASYGCHPLWALDEDIYGDFAPEELGLSPELTADLNAWAEAFNRDDDWTQQRREAHAAEGRRLATRLKAERPDRMIYVIEGESGVVEVHGNEII